MFDLFRSREKSVRILLGVLLGLVALSMLIYLIPGGPGGSSAGGQNTVAMVGDEKITTIDVQRVIDNYARNQPNIPRSFYGSMLNSIVNQLVESKAMAYKARQMGLQVSDDELSDAIQADFTRGFGSFDPALYKTIVERQIGMTVPDFEKQERDQILAQRLESLESQSMVITDAEARAEYQRKNLKVGVEYIGFTQKDFLDKVKSDPAAVRAYFDKNRVLFRTPEKRSGTLLVASAADFLQAANISPNQLQQAYNGNKDAYQIPERVRVRHILIKTQGKPKDQAAPLKTKAQDLLAQLQHGGDFAELAKKNSEDPGSAEKGGELGWLLHGQTVPNFDKTAFSLTPGQLSGVIETEYGYHILQLEEKQAAHTQTLDEVRPQLEGELRKQAASENLKRTIDAARAEVAKAPLQADAIAKKYNLHSYALKDIGSNGTLPDASAPNVLNAIFSAPKNGVTDVVSLDAQGKSAFAVVSSVQPARNAEFNEVQAEAQQKYTQTEADRMAQDTARTAAARARKGEPLDAIAKSYGLSVKTAAPFTIDGAAEGIGSASELQAAFKANPGDVFGPVSVPAGQFVCKVSQKLPADLNQFAANKTAIVQSLTQQRQSVQGSLFRASVLDEMRKKKKIKLNQDTINQMMSSFQA